MEADLAGAGGGVEGTQISGADTSSDSMTCESVFTIDISKRGCEKVTGRDRPAAGEVRRADDGLMVCA